MSENHDHQKIIDITTLELRAKCPGRTEFMMLMAGVYAINYKQEGFEVERFKKLVLTNWEKLKMFPEFEGEISIEDIIAYAQSEFIEK